MKTKWTYVNAATKEVSQDDDVVNSWPMGESEIQWQVYSCESRTIVVFNDDFEGAKRFLLSEEAKRGGFIAMDGVRLEYVQ